MSIQTLEHYLPAGALPFLRKWFGAHYIHIKIAKRRTGKLGDYRRMPDSSHKITINHDLPPALFFFVLTHELAHLLAFEHNKTRKIAPHGTEWKRTFAAMLAESLAVYPEDLRPILTRFTLAPKASFGASPELVHYFKKGL